MYDMMCMSWVEYEKMSAQKGVVLVPVGSVEVYGPHLPLGTDGIVAQKLAKRVAEASNVCLVAPLIPIGFAKDLQEFPGTLSVSPETLKAYLRETALSFIRWGAKRILFLNGHLGNVAPIRQLLLELQEEHGTPCAQVDIWRFIQPISGDILESTVYPHGHAGEAMTSVMLFIAPELVANRDNIVLRQPAWRDAFPDIIKETSFRKRTQNGVLGDPTVASKKKGEVILGRAVNRLVRFIREDGFIAS